MPLRFTVALTLLASTVLLSSATVASAAEEKTNGDREPNPKSKLVWLDAEGGIASADLRTFNADFKNFAFGFLPQSGIGPQAGAAVGVRFVFLTLGVRGRVASFQDDDPNHHVRDWTMSSLNGEVGVRVPLKRAEPYLTLGGGYTTFGGFGEALDGASRGFNVNGFNVRVGAGFDYFVTRYVSVGALGSAEVLALTRPGVPVREVAKLPSSQTADVAVVRALEARDSTYGLALALTGGVGVHF